MHISTNIVSAVRGTRAEKVGNLETNILKTVKELEKPNTVP
jgi:hypothetical protein